MYTILKWLFEWLFIITACVAVPWWGVTFLLSFGDLGGFWLGIPAIILFGAPVLVFLAFLPKRLLVRWNRSRIKKMILAYLDAQGMARDLLGPVVSSDDKPTAMAFYGQGEVILASAQGECYVERFDIDELRWREIRNKRGEYIGIEALPSAQRSKTGTLQVLSGWNLPGEVRAIYGANGIPLP